MRREWGCLKKVGMIVWPPDNIQGPFCIYISDYPESIISYFMRYPLTIFAFVFMAISTSVIAQKKSKVFQPNLPGLLKSKEIAVVNRNASIAFNEGKFVLHLDAKLSSGMAWFDNKQFATGTIEFDVKGNNKRQGSFVGFAFHRTGEAYDAIYFRPFNFHAASSVSRMHSVQYISIPGHDWNQLRQSAPGKYEHEIEYAPAADSWFHVKIAVTNANILVFVNNSEKPCLTVEKLNQRKTGGFGFWVGNGSDGDFANLKIISDKQ